MDIICGLLLGVIVLWAIVGAIYDKLRGINDDIQYALFKLDRIEDLINDKKMVEPKESGVRNEYV